MFKKSLTGLIDKMFPSRIPKNQISRSKTKFTVFSIIAAIALPIAILCGTELVLRLLHFGYDTRFFQLTKSQDKVYCVDNPSFGRRFFPPALVRTSEKLRFPLYKGDNEKRIFILGASAAQGDPATAFAFSRNLDVMLQGRYGQSHCRVINTAVTAINSHIVVPIAQECSRLSPDVFIVYLGNNEVIGPFGPGTVFSRFSNLWFVHLRIFLSSTRLWQLASTVSQSIIKSNRIPAGWGGMKMFLQHKIRFDDPKMTQVYLNFQDNLREICKTARRSGARVVLCTVASNLKNCGPFYSMHRPDLSPDALKQWERYYQHAVDLQNQGHYQPALDLLAKAASLDSTSANMHFRMAQCLDALGQFDKARQHYIDARDYDGLRFRTDSRLNQIIREVAREFNNCAVLLDTEDRLGASSDHGICGKELFLEHVHYNFHGNYLLAASILPLLDSMMAMPDTVPYPNIVDLSLSKFASTHNLLSKYIEGKENDNIPNYSAALLPSTYSERGKGLRLSFVKSKSTVTAAHPSSETDCRERLAFTPWEELVTDRAVYDRLTKPPFTNQIDNLLSVRELEQAIQQLSAVVANSGQDIVASYLRASSLDPQDWRINDLFGRYLLLNDSNSVKVEQVYRKVSDIIPNNQFALYSLAIAMERQRRNSEAIEYYHKAIQIDPLFFDAYVNLADDLITESRIDEAERYLKKVLLVNPEHAYAQERYSQVLLMNGNGSSYKPNFDKNIISREALASAYNRTGLRLVKLNDLHNAIGQFECAATVYPEHFLAQSNLARALVKTGKINEGIEHFKKAICIDSTHPEVRVDLGDALTAQGLPNDAEKEYRAALSVNPKMVSALYGLGLTLTKQDSFAQAIDLFARAIEGRPSFMAAHENLIAACAHVNQQGQAISILTRLSTQYPQSAEIHYSLGKLLFEQGNTAEAQKQLKIMTQLHPDLHKQSASVEHPGKNLVPPQTR